MSPRRIVDVYPEGRDRPNRTLLTVPVVLALGLQLVFWGHRLPVVRWVAGPLAWLSRQTEPVVGLTVARFVFLLPAAMVVVLAPGVVRRRSGPGDVVLLVLGGVLSALCVLVAVILTRGVV